MHFSPMVPLVFQLLAQSANRAGCATPVQRAQASQVAETFYIAFWDKHVTHRTPYRTRLERQMLRLPQGKRHAL